MDSILVDLLMVLVMVSWGDLLCIGLKVVIIGCLNVGKLSLLNVWSCSDCVIVIDFFGIMRDVVEF